LQEKSITDKFPKYIQIKQKIIAKRKQVFMQTSFV